MEARTRKSKRRWTKVTSHPLEKRDIVNVASNKGHCTILIASLRHCTGFERWIWIEVDWTMDVCISYLYVLNVGV